MLTWPEAEIYCREVEGGHLASIRTLKENKYIERKLRMLRYYYGYSKWWIGASDLENEGQFNWTDGKPFAIQHWVPREPSGRHRGREEDCAVITADPYWGRWRDEYCLHHLPFICKIRGETRVLSISSSSRAKSRRSGMFLMDHSHRLIGLIY